MTATLPSLRDPRILAQEIREVAARAHETLHDPLRDDQVTHALAQRISDLQVVIDGLASNDLSQWLKNLQSRLDPAASRTPSRATPARSTPPRPE